MTLAFTVGLVLVFTACGGPDPITPEPGTSATLDAESVVPSANPSATLDGGSIAPGPTPTREAVVLDSIQEPEFYGAASPSVEKRILDSDVIIRASLQSVTSGALRFKAIEYLKGTGPAEIVVIADESMRDATLDGREAVLFLSLPESSGAVGSSAPEEFVFTSAHYQNPGGYTIDTLDPAWLPAEGEVGASGASGTRSDLEFVTDSGAAFGGTPQTISQTDLRSKIAWVEGGENIEGYDRCIGIALNYEQYYRDWEAYHGQPWTPLQEERQVASGASQGTAPPTDIAPPLRPLVHCLKGCTGFLHRRNSTRRYLVISRLSLGRSSWIGS